MKICTMKIHLDTSHPLAEPTHSQAIRKPYAAAGLWQFPAIILTGLLMVAAPTTAWADEESFDASEVIREAGIGTWSRDYYSQPEEDATESSVTDDYHAKSETIYVDGKAVCFKLESNVSVAYYCDG